MMPRANRLSSRDIEFFWERGDIKRRPTSFFIAYCAKNEIGYNRYTVVVGSKVDRRAVKRNAIRRRLKEALRPHLHYNKGQDIVIVALPKIRTAKREEIITLLAEAFRTN